MSFPIVNRSLDAEFDAEVAVVNPGNVDNVDNVDNVEEEEEEEELPLCDCTEVIAKPLFEAPIKLGECCICFEDMEMVNFMVTRCGHAFHASCMFRTLEMNDNCPMCRTQLIPDCVDDDDDSDYDYEEGEEGEEGDDEESVVDEDEEGERRVEATLALAAAAKVVVDLVGEQAVVEVVEEVLGKDLHKDAGEQVVVEVVEEILGKVVHEVTNNVINNYHNEIISRLFVGGNREEVCANVIAIMDEINKMKQTGCKCN